MEDSGTGDRWFVGIAAESRGLIMIPTHTMHTSAAIAVLLAGSSEKLQSELPSERSFS